jgi:hypothetical protein
LDFNFKMEFIKRIVFLLLIPVFAYGQTAHIDSNRVAYKGMVKVNNVNKEELYARAQHAIRGNVKNEKEVIIAENKEKGMIVAKGSIKLPSPYHLIKALEYVLELSVEDGNYKYRIDSVYIKQSERGGKTIKIPSAHILKGMDESGLSSAIAEKQLNEIDMNFQKLLALFKADMKKTAVVANHE